MFYIPPHLRKGDKTPLAPHYPPPSTSSSQTFASSNSSSGPSQSNAGFSIPLAVLQPKIEVSASASPFPSLQAIAFSSLAPHLEDLLSSLEEDDLTLADLSVPFELAAALIALAKRSSVLSNRTLKLLATPVLTTLDLGLSARHFEQRKRAPLNITPIPFASTIRALPELRELDLRRLDHLTKASYLLLGDLPLLQTLYVGGTERSSAEFLKALDDLLDHRKVKPIDEGEDVSWEELAEADAGQGRARWQALRKIVWPDAPSAVADQIRAEVPSIEALREDPPGPGEAYLERLVSPALRASWQRKEAFAELNWEDLPQAERFRLAFVLRDYKRAEARRKFREKTAGKVTDAFAEEISPKIAKWMDELKL